MGRAAPLCLSLFAALGACIAGLSAAEPPSCAELAAPYRPYTLPLISFVPEPGQVAGVLLRARINGGPPLRLLLDSGAEHITVAEKAARRSGLSAASSLMLVGAGESPAGSAETAFAASLAMGALSFRNCRVDVVPGGLASGIDGVVPLSLFSGFLIRLDLSGNSFALSPYADGAAAPAAGFTPVLRQRGLLLLRATLNGAREGYALLDTGASCSAISRDAARALGLPPVAPAAFRGAGGPVAGDYVKSGVQFQIAGRSLGAGRVAALDLAALAHSNGVDIAGVLGYPELRHSVLTVDYRDALVSLEAGPKHRF